ncbi:MAG: zf-HC2 domain-containing protein, partial [Candidatus Limnocylindria bacterium]|nr:zf-HC2 domain-containing protein [Candidatus Limnocylindria bacterium]
MTHVIDDLELYALDALSAPERARVSAHLGECPACREQARALEDVVVALPDTLPQGDVPARLRARILSSARGDLAPAARRTPGTAWISRFSLSRVAIAGLTAAVLVLGLVDVAMIRQRDAALAERDEYSDVALRVSHGGRSWYMAGLDRWAGSGGTLYAPAKADAAAFVV